MSWQSQFLYQPAEQSSRSCCPPATQRSTRRHAGSACRCAPCNVGSRNGDRASASWWMRFGTGGLAACWRSVRCTWPMWQGLWAMPTPAVSVAHSGAGPAGRRRTTRKILGQSLARSVSPGMQNGTKWPDIGDDMRQSMTQMMI